MIFHMTSNMMNKNGRYLTVVDLRPFCEQIKHTKFIFGVETVESTKELTDSVSIWLLEGLPTYRTDKSG